ncbi:MAG: hypothetical protein WC485_07355 [Opitutaceae bacterium]
MKTPSASKLRCGMPAAFLLLTLFLHPAVRAEESWKTFEKTADNYSVSMPATAKESSEPVSDKLGTHQMNSIMGQEGTTIYIIGCLAYDSGTKLDIEGELLANRDNFMKAVQAHLLDSNRYEFSGCPALDFKAANDQGYVFEGRVVLVGGRIVYQLATAYKGSEAPPGIRTFLDSFKFLEPATP